MSGIYFHIPFCKQACHYCDFHFSTNLTVRNDMVAAQIRELELRYDYLHGEVNTVYFGGGTPSLLPVSQLKQLVESVYALFRVSDVCEITIEANPDDLSQGYLHDLKKAGVNRLSIGIQSFDDKVLRFLNRAHDSGAARICIEQAREAGFGNISIDLIYAIPGQPTETWLENVNQAVHYSPDHISAYALTIEEKTAFGNWASKGKLVPLDDDATLEQMDLLTQTLADNGYEQYEVSNFAKPGYQSQHNSSYWRGSPYLGIGPGAHSYNVESRQFNVRNNHEYLRWISRGEVPATIEVLTTAEKVNDYLLTTLRTSWGTDFAFIRNTFQIDLLALHDAYISSLVQNGYASWRESHLRLTRRGLAVADKISADLFVQT